MSYTTLYAILTGDVVDSSKITSRHRDLLLNTLKASFNEVSKQLAGNGQVSFDIFRGDSFQGLIPDPREALTASLMIRANLRSEQPDKSAINWDSRTAIGIGTVEYLPNQVSEGDGQAYRSSGHLLDEMKTKQRLLFHTPWEEIDKELNTQAALLDAIIAKWSPQQAEVVLDLLRQKSRKQIGEELGISQAAVYYRVKGSGWNAIEKFLDRYRALIDQHVHSLDVL